MNIRKICTLAPVIPVIVIDAIDHAAPLARALIDGGLKVLEVTLRTPVALEAIRRMIEVAPDAIVGVGTLMSPSDMAAAKEAGAVFGVSPGATPELLDTARDMALPMLPGVATPSEAMAANACGYEVLKFFPAEANGGVTVLKAWSSPLASISFCPTGGVSLANAETYLGLSNVLCVGGSWVAPKTLMQQGDWAGITKLAREAKSLDAG